MTSSKSTLIALIALAITPVANAQIYKCDGPDGPIFSDQKCGPGATTVDVSVSSGLGGISDETKNELAAKRADREKARKNNNNGTTSKNQNSALSTDYVENGQWVNGQWIRRPIRRPGRDGSGAPKPVQLPANKTGGKRRN